MVRALLADATRRDCRRALLRRLQLALFSVAALLGLAMAATGPTAFITDWPGYVQQPRVSTESRQDEARQVQRQRQRRSAPGPRRRVTLTPPPPPRRPTSIAPHAAPAARSLPAPPASPIVVRGPPLR